MTAPPACGDVPEVRSPTSGFSWPFHPVGGPPAPQRWRKDGRRRRQNSPQNERSTMARTGLRRQPGTNECAAQRRVRHLALAGRGYTASRGTRRPANTRHGRRGSCLWDNRLPTAPIHTRTSGPAPHPAPCLRPCSRGPARPLGDQPAATPGPTEPRLVLRAWRADSSGRQAALPGRIVPAECQLRSRFASERTPSRATCRHG